MLKIQFTDTSGTVFWHPHGQFRTDTATGQSGAGLERYRLCIFYHPSLGFPEPLYFIFYRVSMFMIQEK